VANKNFILQGFTADTHTDAIRKLFDLDNIERVIISVAFVNLGGVELMEAQLKKYKSKTTAFIGIRNDITTIQGAQRLFELGVSLYTVDTGTRRVIYHPKIYFVRGTKHAKLIVSSANLTPGGFNNNIEAGIVVECDLTSSADRELVESIERSFDEAQAAHPSNISKITTAAQLKKQHTIGLLIDEMAAFAPKPSSSGTSTSDDTTPRIKLKTKPITSSISAAKRVAKRAAAKPAAKKSFSKKGAPAPKDDQELASGVELVLVWQSKELTRRDLDVPKAGTNTNRTGSINLDKGLMTNDVDHRHYFREGVFEALTWSPSTATVDEAYAKFQLVVKGVSYGEFDLRIAHTTSTKTRSYLQSNAMTRLSWGAAREFVARPDLIGRGLSLYRDNANSKKFVLEID
jgi:HKD family nuclease